LKISLVVRSAINLAAAWENTRENAISFRTSNHRTSYRDFTFDFMTRFIFVRRIDQCEIKAAHSKKFAQTPTFREEEKKKRRSSLHEGLTTIVSDDSVVGAARLRDGTRLVMADGSWSRDPDRL